MKNALHTLLKEKSIFYEAQRTGLSYVLDYNPDRFLSPCYTALGKTAPCSPYGGWESRTIQGHMLGHYLSALSQFYFYANSSEALDKIKYTVEKIKSLQRSDGYFGGIPSSPFEEVASSKGNFSVERFSLASWWVPWYSVHKIYAGLIDVAVLCKKESELSSLALDIVTKMADWAMSITSKLDTASMQKMLYCEHGGMCKVFADLYALTKQKKYLTEAVRWIHHEVIDPAIQGKDALQGYHANTQIPKFIALARLYDLTGNQEYRNAVEFFFENVTQKRSYVIGGNSIGEHFTQPLLEKLGKDTCETCNSYNMLELAEYVFSWHAFRWNEDDKLKTVETANFYEKTLYNHILASQAPSSGAKTYFVSMLPGTFKVYSSKENSMWCCVGTGIENPARYGRFIATDTGSDIYINLFIPSTITTEDGWCLSIETDFPYKEETSVVIVQKGKNERCIKIRHPLWEESQGGTYLEYDCVNAGDRISVKLPMHLHVRYASSNDDLFSLMYGPLVLACDLGRDNMPNDIVDDHLVYMQEPKPVKVPLIKQDLNNLDSWLECTDKEKLTFSGAGLNFVPFYALHHSYYAVYFSSKESLSQDLLGVEGRADNIEDFVECGRQQSEVEHFYEGANTHAQYIEALDKSGRTITPNAKGFFSYKFRLWKTKKLSFVIALEPKTLGSLSVSLGDTKLNDISNTSEDSNLTHNIKLEIPEDFVASKMGEGDYCSLALRFDSLENEPCPCVVGVYLISE